MSCDKDVQKAEEINNKNGSGIKFRTVSLTEIGSHPFMSLAPEDYLPNDEYIRKLLMSNNPNDQKRLTWMISSGTVTQERMEKIIAENSAQKMQTVEAHENRMKVNLKNVLDNSQKQNKK